MSDPADIQRLIGDIVRLGTVASIDLAGGTCCVTIGDVLTNDLPWIAGRAGGTRIWAPPSVGEQVMVIAPEGDTEAGVVIGSLFSDAHPAPSAEPVTLIIFADGAEIAYDPAAHQLRATLPGGGTAEINAPGGIRLVGDVAIEGKLTATGDVKAGGISLQQHVHGQVAAGGAQSGEPV